MELDPDLVDAVAKVAAAGGAGGLLGGFLAGRGKGLVGGILMGVIGGIAASSIIRIAGFPAILPVGDEFSLVYAFVGGLLLGGGVLFSTRS